MAYPTVPTVIWQTMKLTLSSISLMSHVDWRENNQVQTSIRGSTHHSLHRAPISQQPSWRLELGSRKVTVRRPRRRDKGYSIPWTERAGFRGLQAAYCFFNRATGTWGSAARQWARKVETREKEGRINGEAGAVSLKKRDIWKLDSGIGEVMRDQICRELQLNLQVTVRTERKSDLVLRILRLADLAM